MALTGLLFKLIVDLRRRIDDRPPPLRLLALGYPDVLVEPKVLAEMVGAEKARTVPWRADSEAILNWHGLSGALPGVYETIAVFAALGIELSCIDIVRSRDIERIVDLNEPLPGDLVGRFDIVFDGGTLEHCFNVGQAIRNVASAVRVGGYVVHANPLSMVNHGFFNFSPTFYHDFYTQNGFRLHLMLAHWGSLLAPQIANVAPLARVRTVPAESNVVAVVQRNEDIELRWPMQSKYLANPNLKG